MLVDQTPIGRTPRSNPVTYLKAFDPIREILSLTKDAQARGLSASHFSFNVPGGRCEACQGEGIVRVEMQFLADVFVPCEHCDGKRFKPNVLEVRYKGKNVHQILEMTVREAIAFFSSSQKVLRRLQVLDEIGLGYLRLGQPATTLSGGEAQRIKIAAHLASSGGERVLYILDEPTTGLHFDDIAKLLAAFRKLVEAGHTLVVIEHNLDVIKTADYVIDLGPEGGEGGGEVVAVGTPEQVAKVEASHTGRALAPGAGQPPRGRGRLTFPTCAVRQRLPRAFYCRPTLHVAEDLIGKVVVHRARRQCARGRVPSSRSRPTSASRTPRATPRPDRHGRNAPLYGPPGISYVYLNYGMHYLLNAVTEPEGNPAAVLIRALAPLEGLDTMRRRRGGRVRVPDRRSVGSGTRQPGPRVRCHAAAEPDGSGQQQPGHRGLGPDDGPAVVGTADRHPGRRRSPLAMLGHRSPGRVGSARPSAFLSQGSARRWGRTAVVP